MRRWQVAGGLLADDRGLLLVANRRRSGALEWSTPGGVVDSGETTLGALGREVEEETGLVVDRWSRLCWTVEVMFVDLDMHLAVEVHQAEVFNGDLSFDDPDGIVEHGAFLDRKGVLDRVSTSPPWVSDPLREWMNAPWPETHHFRYDALGDRPHNLRAIRTTP